MLARLLDFSSNWYQALIALLWIGLVLYWLISAAGAKRTLRGGWVWWREVGLRLLIFVGVLSILRLSSPTGPFPGLRSLMVNSNLLLGVTGAAICAVGVGFAIWARVYLGRNWGMPMSQKEQPEITTTGPYAYVRHPIYAGFLLAMLGSAVGQTLIWLVPFVVVGAYFTYSARREEKLMLQQFPEAYRAYMRTTKMLVPFIW